GREGRQKDRRRRAARRHQQSREGLATSAGSAETPRVALWSAAHRGTSVSRRRPRRHLSPPSSRSASPTSGETLSATPVGYRPAASPSRNTSPVPWDPHTSSRPTRDTPSQNA